jgi:hypothetical protein
MSETHFEQIAVETVKKIATDVPQRCAIENDGVGLETQEKITPNQKDWRRLAQLIQQEQDPERLTQLTEQLIAALEASVERRSPRHQSLMQRGDTH